MVDARRGQRREQTAGGLDPLGARTSIRFGERRGEIARAANVAYATTSGVGTPRSVSAIAIASSRGARVSPRNRSPVNGASMPPWREWRTTTRAAHDGSATAYAIARPSSARFCAWPSAYA